MTPEPKTFDHPSRAALGVIVLAAGAVLLSAACSGPRGAPATMAPPATTAPPAHATTATLAPSSRPETGRILCGSSACRVGKEMCCLGDQPHCLAIPPKDPEEGELGRFGLCKSSALALCDDAGDCAAGETCCRTRVMGSDGATLDESVCTPLRGGRVVCEYEERCSTDDPRCLRRGATCAAGACGFTAAARTRPRCGAAPCPAGSTCVETGGVRSCKPGELRYPETLDVIECDRGRDCADGEACYKNPQAGGHRCDFGLAGVDALSEPALCAADADCADFCKGPFDQVASCWLGRGPAHGTCECTRRCTKNEDCANACMSLKIRREDNATPTGDACDKARGLCKCVQKGI